MQFLKKGFWKTLEKILYALRDRYKNSEYTGDFTFVVQPITNNFWKSHRISESVINKLGKVAEII